MRWLRRLFAEPQPEFAVRVWLTSEGKLADLADRVQLDSHSGVYPLVVFHFPATGDRLIQTLQDRGVTYRLVEAFRDIEVGDVDRWRRVADVLIFNSALLPWPANEQDAPVGKDDSLPAVSVHMAEPYPLTHRDRAVLALDRVWPMPMRFTCYSAMDDALIERFVSPRLRRLLGWLGVTPDECLEDPRLGKAIRRAQQDVEKKVINEYPCDSYEQWFRRNLPS